jgi:hypothetical protein
VHEVARFATRSVYDLADEYQRYERAFPNLATFRRWAMESAHREALRLLPRQPHIQPWIEQLPLSQRSVVLWLYVDQVTDRQLARVLRMTPVQARHVALEAYQALCALLRAHQWGHDDDPRTFPLPPILAGIG